MDLEPPGSFEQVPPSTRLLQASKFSAVFCFNSFLEETVHLNCENLLTPKNKIKIVVGDISFF